MLAGSNLSGEGLDKPGCRATVIIKLIITNP